MNETAPESATAPSLTLDPLPFADLPPATQKLLGGAAPAKMLALKGLAPLRPLELALAVYQLRFDPEPQVKAAAEVAPGTLPDRVLAPLLAEALPPVVLHAFAQGLPAAKGELFDKLLYNKATADETFVALAARLGERECEIICENEARLLRCPAIVAALFGNASARMSSVNRAVELCARNGVRVEGIPCFEDVAQSISSDPTAKDAATDVSFAAAVESTRDAEPQAEAEAEPAAPPPTAAPSSPATPASTPAARPRPEPKKDDAKKKATVDFTKLKLYEKIRLATLGNAYCRTNLMRDPNKLVALAAIKSPLITDSEVVAAAASKQVSEDVIRYIANSREFTKLYGVRWNLTTNPKTPIAFSMKFLSTLRNEDIKKVASSKNVPSALATTARRLAAQRGK